MQAGEKLSLRYALIKQDFWSELESGDPVSSEKAAGILLQRVEEKLDSQVLLFVLKVGENARLREVRVNWRQMTSVLAREENFCLAICKAAIELPSFLERHPECAANHK